MNIWKVLAVVVLLMFLAVPVQANSVSSYQMTHDLEISMDGEWNLSTDTYTPAQGGYNLDLEGVGEAYIKSQLEIYSVTKVSSTWYDLF